MKATTASSGRLSEDERFGTNTTRTSSTASKQSILKHALAGAAGGLLLSVIEQTDLNIQLTPVFASAAERLTLAAYTSLNILLAALAGLAIGVVARAAVASHTAVDKRVGKKDSKSRWPRLITSVVLLTIGSAFLFVMPGPHNYVLGIVREMEKIALARVLLKAEPVFTYVIIVALLASCWLLWRLCHSAARAGKAARFVWLLLLLGLIAIAYYADSRVEVQQYQFSLHRSMFLLEVAVSQALVASLYFGSHRVDSPQAQRYRAALITCGAVAVLIAAVFTFLRFDRNQNLKTQVFFRSTVTMQFVTLAQWVLDFDRDGYSALLGGGDADDTRADINPARSEITGDGSDNNCIGGDLSQQDLERWFQQMRSLNMASTAASNRFNVVFVFVDAVRADHLSVYGYPRNTTPALSKLAERSCVFDNAFSPSPSTYQSVPKFMQSSYWDAHVETWTEVLARNGYGTILFPARRAATLYRRIQDPRLISANRTGNLKETVDAVIRAFETKPADRPICSYVYAFEPHMPYKPRSEFHFGNARADLYDGEVAYVDHQLGRLFEWLEQHGRFEDTMIVVMSDHGESLGERGVYKHNAQLYNEQMHVPMMIYYPGAAARRIPEYVSTVDLGSTILNAVGLKCPAEYVGTSLLPLLQGNPVELPPVYGEHWQRNDSPFWGPERNVDPEIHKFMVITQDGYKLIRSRNYNTFELFNLNVDLGELHNLYDEMPLKSAELKALLGRFIDVVSVSRPFDADEQRFFRGTSDDEKDEDK